MGWEAYNYVGQCIDLQMEVFQRLLPAPLNATELQWFEQMHRKQAHFGNLPFVLLVERFSFLSSVIWEIWEKAGDAEAVAIMWRLLDYYGEMASTRRANDRRVQQRRGPGAKFGNRAPLTDRLSTDVSIDDESEDGSSGTNGGDEPEVLADLAEPGEAAIPDSMVVPDAAQVEAFLDIAELVRRRENVRCRCAAPEWDDKVIGMTGGSATIEHTCISCGFSSTSTLTLTQLTAIAFEAQD
jgi:hypothetical protein